MILKGLDQEAQYQERLAYESRVVREMGFCGYFLIVADIVNWAKDSGIFTGVGRGSAAGSIISFVLGITQLDPIKYGLIFERFLNPERVSYPDIDLDFDEIERGKVIEYIQSRYGQDCVAHIGTYGSMKARGSIRDVTRSLGLPYDTGDLLARLVLPPIAGKPQDLNTCYNKVPELKALRDKKGPSADILNWAEKFEDRLRSFGVHPSGIVISDRPINTVVPIALGRDDIPTTQYEMHAIEELGLIKFDVLGLRALTTMKRCISFIEKDKNLRIDLSQIPVDDQKTYKLFQEGITESIFQMEGSQGIHDLTVQVNPKNLEDLSLIAALYRPGPLGCSGMVSQVVQVRNGSSEPQYLVKELEPILKETAGVMVYQEQIMEVCRELAGYTMAEADNMRKIIGKKLPKEMEKERSKFVKGMLKNKFPKGVADTLFSQIAEFALYSFNKAHSICYSYIAYQMAYLKTHHPLQFMCACLASEVDETEKIIRYIRHCKELNLTILPPDINKSEVSFSTVKDEQSIRFGLAAIKNLGEVPVQAIIEERNKNGRFDSLYDFSNRVDLSQVNKRKLESLVLAGAFDDVSSQTRSSLMLAADAIYEHKQKNKSYLAKMTTYESRMAKYNNRLAAIGNGENLKPLKLPQKPIAPVLPEIPNVPEFMVGERLTYEKNLLGYYISGHPLDNIAEKSKLTIQDIKEIESNRKNLSIIAIPSSIKEITTKKKKQKMAYLNLEDRSGTIEAVILPNPYHQYGEILRAKVPAEYIIEADVVELDIQRLVKVRIQEILQLVSVISQEQLVTKIKVPLSKAYKAAQIIAENKGTEYRVSLIIESPNGNLWGIGPFWCKGNRNYLQWKVQQN